MKLNKKGCKRHFSNALDISNQVLGFVGWVGGGMENCIPIDITTILGCAGGVKKD